MEDKHRYLVITELFLPTKGGTAVWFGEVFRRLGGKDIHIVTADVTGAEEVDLSHPNTIHRLKLNRVAWLRPESLGMYARLFIKSLWLAMTNKFEAIHAIRSLPEGLVAWAVARLTSHPVIIYAHGEELTSWGNGLKFKTMCFTLHHADKVVANSDYTQEVLIRLGVDANKISIVYPGVDISRFRPDLPSDDLRKSIGLQAGQKLVLSVGRLSRRKGFDKVIHSLPLLKQQGFNVHYALIGIGEDHKYLTELAEEMGVREYVHLLGHVTSKDLPRWYNACDVFVMPNREINGDTEGFGMVFLEAAACGIPTIAGSGGGTGAAVLDGVTGLRVDGEKIVEVSSALVRVLSDRDYASILGKQGHDRAVADFGWEAVANKTAALLDV